MSKLPSTAELIPKTDDKLPSEVMVNTGDGDSLRAVAETVLQITMEADVEGLIDATRHE